jgi:hypothetical protein
MRFSTKTWLSGLLLVVVVSGLGSCMPSGWPYKSKMSPMKKPFASRLRIAVLPPVADYGKGAQKGFKHTKTRTAFICGAPCAAMLPMSFYDHHEHDWKFKEFSRQLSIALTKDLRAVRVFETVDYRPPSTDYDYIIRPVVVKARRLRGFINVLPVGFLNFATQVLIGGLFGVPWIRTVFNLRVRFEIIAPPQKKLVASFHANAEQRSMLQLIFWIPRGETKVNFDKLLGDLNRYAVFKLLSAIRADAVYRQNKKTRSVTRRRWERFFDYAEKYDPRLIEARTQLEKKEDGTGSNERTVDYLLRLQQIRLRHKLERDGASAASELFLKADEQAVTVEYKKQKAKTLNLVSSIAGAAAGAASAQIGNLAASGAISVSSAKGMISNIATFKDIIKKGIDIELSRTYTTPKRIEKKMVMTGGVLEKWSTSVLKRAGVGGRPPASKAMRHGLIKIAYAYGRALAQVKDYAAAIKAFDRTYQGLYDVNKSAAEAKGRLVARKVVLAGATISPDEEMPKLKDSESKHVGESLPRKAARRKKAKSGRSTNQCRKDSEGVRIRIRHVEEYGTVAALVNHLNARAVLSPVTIIKFGERKATLCVGRDLSVSAVASALMDKRTPWKLGIVSLQRRTIVVKLKGKRKTPQLHSRRQGRTRPPSRPKARQRVVHKKGADKTARKRRRIEKRRKAGGCGRDARGTTVVIRRVKRFLVADKLRKALKQQRGANVALKRYKRRTLTLCVSGKSGSEVAAGLHRLGEQWDVNVRSVTSHRVKCVLRKYRRRRRHKGALMRKVARQGPRAVNGGSGASGRWRQVQQAEEKNKHLGVRANTGQAEGKIKEKTLQRTNKPKEKRGPRPSLRSKEERGKQARNVKVAKGRYGNRPVSQLCRKGGRGIRVYMMNVKSQRLAKSLQRAISRKKRVKRVEQIRYKKRKVYLCVAGLPAARVAGIVLAESFPWRLKIVRYSPKRLVFSYVSRK